MRLELFFLEVPNRDVHRSTIVAGF